MTMKCSYGIMRRVHIRHKPVLKQHYYPSRPVYSIESSKERYRMGTPRFSETELLYMIIRGLYTLSRS